MKEDLLKAGVNFATVKIKPAALRLSLLSPTRRQFKAGESVEIRVEALYPDGNPVGEGILVAVLPPGRT